MQFLKLIFPRRFYRFLSPELFNLLILSLVLKFFLMVFAIHPDFFFIHMFPNLLVSHGVVNIYELFASELSNKPGFYYSPPVFYFFSAVQIAFKPILPGFSIYMDNAFEIYKSGLATPLAYLNSFDINYFRPFFLLKLPYILFDLGVSTVIVRLVDSWPKAKKAFLFWIFNPVVLYGTYAYGQFDIIPTFLLLLTLFLGLKKRIILAMLTIGLAATFKNFALVAILPVAFSLGKDYRNRLMLSLIGLSPFVLSLLCVYIQAPSQVLYTLIPKFYLSKTALDENVYSSLSKFTRYFLLFISYISVLGFSLFAKINLKEKIIGLVTFNLLSLFAFSPVILFHYLTIVTPFLILLFADRKKFTQFFYLYIASAAIFKLWTPIQQLGLLAPINNSFLYLPSTSEIISKVFPYTYLSSIFYIVFFILSLHFMFEIATRLIFKSELKRKPQSVLILIP